MGYQWVSFDSRRLVRSQTRNRTVSTYREPGKRQQPSAVSNHSALVLDPRRVALALVGDGVVHVHAVRRARHDHGLRGKRVRPPYKLRCPICGREPQSVCYCSKSRNWLRKVATSVSSGHSVMDCDIRAGPNERGRCAENY